MKSTTIAKTLAITSLVAMGATACTSNPFQADGMDKGYQHSSKVKDAKCGEAKCGGDMKKADHKCGEAKCGGHMKKADHKCGEGKCGGDMKKADHKCGEGKCGGSK